MPVRRIGVAGCDQLFDDDDHLGDMLRRARLHVRIKAAQRMRVFLKDRVRRLGQLADRDRALGGARVDLVVHVRDVAHIFYMRSAVEVTQQTIQHVEDDQRAGIADVRVIINRWAADIHAHIARIDGRKIFFGARERVVEAQIVRRRHK